MKKRPLCILCLTFLMTRGILLLLTSGEGFVKIPASSIFSKQEKAYNVFIQGQVYQKRNTSKVQILYLKNNSIIQGNDSYYESKILIYDDTFTEIPVGKTISLKGQMNRFEKARNPGNFDQQFYYAKQSIYGYAWSDEIIRITGRESLLLEGLHEFRLQCMQATLSNMTEENGNVLNAMLMGDKAGMDGDVKELYQKNGLAHLLAISGLHISFIGLGIYGFIRKMGISYAGSGVLSIMVLSLYVIMIGFSVSVFRAYVMLLLRIGADIAGRVYDMVTALLFAAALIVLHQPLYLGDGAFYLSHGAILGILFVLPIIKKTCPTKKKWLEECQAGIAINLSLFPMLLWFFYEFPVYSLVLNMVAIPLMTGVLGLGIFGSMGALWFPIAGWLFLKPCDVLLSFFQWLGEMGSKLPAARLILGKPNWWEMAIYYVAFILGIKMKKKAGSMFASIVLFAVLVLGLFLKFPNGTLQIAMLDVGQGDCIFMKGPRGHTYLVDCGSSDVEQVGKYRVEPFLLSQGVGQLDYVFVSHGDLDHYSGIVEMMERQKLGVAIKCLVMPSNYKKDDKLLHLAKLATQCGTTVAVMDGGKTISEGELQLKCLQPRKDQTMLEGNAGSMVLSLTFGKFDMLFTGDVEKEGEELLGHNLSGKSYDILKVAHHGSQHSTEDTFLQIVKPKLALISVGEKNSYGHPHAETIERLHKWDCKVLKTMEWGAIMLKTDGEFIDIFPSSI